MKTRIDGSSSKARGSSVAAGAYEIVAMCVWVHMTGVGHVGN